MRSRMGDGYIEALWAAHKKVNRSADFVMYWWDRAAELLTAKGTRLQRFGLVTTNSITQVFQRRTIERHLAAQRPVSLVMAIPDHPWTKATRDAAAVRIAMTVAAAGTRDGVLREVMREADLGSDQPLVELTAEYGKINADLTVGADVTKATELLSNAGISSPGVKLHGDGFIVSQSEATALGLGRIEGLDAHIREYRNGRDLTARPRGVKVIDLFGLDAEQVRHRFPEVYQYVIREVKEKVNDKGEKVGRDWNNRDSYKKNWWVFGEPRGELRPALAGLKRYIATPVSPKHRVIQFLKGNVLPDDALIAISLEDAAILSILSSSIHGVWVAANAGSLGMYKGSIRYNKSRCFDPFPFPDPVSETLKEQLRSTAEELDETRKQVLEAHPDLTLTKFYNVLEKLKSGETLTDAEADIRERGRVLILKDLHETIDRLTFEAYGWPVDLSDEQILERLVALNAERAAEEAAGQVRWLRPDYQIPRFGTPKEKKQQLEVALVGPEDAKKPSFPKEETRRAIAISGVLASASMPMSPADVASRFRQGKRVEKDVRLTLRSFLRFGDVVSEDGGKTYSLRRVA